MSVRVMTLVWQLALPDSEKIVLLALADCANDEGHCWPGMKSLVAKCSKSDRTIQAAIQSLVDKGHLTRREVPGKGCNYTVHPRKDFTPEAASPPKGTTQTPEAASGKPSRTIPVSNDTGAEAPDLKKQVFDLGVRILVDSGKSAQQARALTGKWRKDHGEAKVIAALLDCQAKAISDPAAWLEKRFTGSKYVSPSGYEYRGDLDAVIREAEKRADWGTYWKAKGDRDAERSAA